MQFVEEILSLLNRCESELKKHDFEYQHRTDKKVFLEITRLREILVAYNDKEPTHEYPIERKGLTGCCNKTVDELPCLSLFTRNPELVTCGKKRLV